MSPQRTAQSSQFQLEPLTVLLSQIISIPFMVINWHIVIMEIAKRRSGQTDFDSLALKWISMLALMGGFIVSIASFASHFDGTCYFMEAVSDITAYSQTLFVGLHQLLLLYHTFARTPNFKGYPLWVFILMSFTGIILVLCLTALLFRTLGICRTECGLDGDYRFYAKTMYIDIEWGVISPYYLFVVVSALHFLWEVITLLLFVYKMHIALIVPNKQQIEVSETGKK